MKNKFGNKSSLLVLAIVFILIGLIGMALYLCLPLRSAKPASGPYIGSLGGVPVAMPRSYVRFVEYDEDPHFMKKGRGLSSERTYESSLRSFGFEVRYPDMASVEVRTPAEKNIYTAMWIRGGINAGENYGSTGDESLENRKNSYLNPKGRCPTCFIFVPLPNKTYGLTGYTPTGQGIDPALREINGGLGTHYNDQNIYFYQDDAGRITTFISCSNRTHGAETCSQDFNLSPVMRAHVSVNYRKALLPHWREIQSSVSALFYSFKVEKTNSPQSGSKGK